MPSSTETARYSPDSASRRVEASVNTSYEKVDQVDSAPQKPVPSSSSPPVSRRSRSAASERKPSSRQAAALAASVPYGNGLRTRDLTATPVR